MQFEISLSLHMKFICNPSILLPAATKLGQGNIFTSVCQEFCPGGGEGVCLSACWDTPPWTRHPPDQAPPKTRHPSSRDQARPSPRTRHPPGPGRPPEAAAPPREADCSIRSTSGRYASYWNTFLSENGFD